MTFQVSLNPNLGDRIYTISRSLCKNQHLYAVFWGTNIVLARNQRCHCLGFLPRSWVYRSNLGFLVFFLRALGFSRVFERTLGFSCFFLNLPENTFFFVVFCR